MINTIIFDFGGVLINWDPRKIVEAYFQHQPHAVDDFMTEIGFSDWNAEQDKGRPFNEGVIALSRSFPQYSNLIHAFRDRWEDSISGPVDGSVVILHQLKEKGYAIYGLSNWSAETFPIIRQRYQFFDLFDGIIISGEVGMVKPDPAIFKLALKMIARPAPECLFIDDSPPNINTAKLLEINTIQYTSPEQLHIELIRHDIL